MKKRSPKFPFLPLAEAVELLRKLSSRHPNQGEAVTRPQLLDAFGYASFHGAAVKTVSALRAYGLLEKGERGLRISDSGHCLLDETITGERRIELLQKAALSPLIFRMLWRRARHSARIELQELLLERGFTEVGAKRASRIYRMNDDFTGIRDLELEPELPERGKKVVAPAIETEPRKVRSANPGRIRPRLHPNSLVLPLSSGSAIVPKGITEAEFDILMQTLHTWRDQLVRKAIRSRGIASS